MGAPSASVSSFVGKNGVPYQRALPEEAGGAFLPPTVPQASSPFRGTDSLRLPWRSGSASHRDVRGVKETCVENSVGRKTMVAVPGGDRWTPCYALEERRYATSVWLHPGDARSVHVSTGLPSVDPGIFEGGEGPAKARMGAGSHRLPGWEA